jgi:ATP synthase protein I
VATEEPSSQPPATPRKRPDSISAQFSTALELPIVLVSAIVVGGVMGYFLDRWLHTKPWLLLIFGGMGFYAGVRDVLRRVSRDN